MQFSTMYSMIEPSFYAPLARAAEEAGFASIGLADSICFPRESSSTYPYNADGTREFLENKPFIEPLICAAAMGSVTTTLRFHTAVLKLPIRNPVIFAKEVTSVAAITGGRFDLGVGISPWEDDYEVTQVPWPGRGRRFEECIEVVTRLSSGEYVEHHGEFYDFRAIKLIPGARVPVLIGGHNDKSLERAARLGDGWLPAGMSREHLAASIKRISELRKRYGRDHLPFAIHAIGMEAFTADGVKFLAELGVTHAVGGFSSFNPYGVEADREPLQAKIDALHRYADDVIARTADVQPAPV
ncbi:MAG TPA: TIGR03619 family F420-dependent LLM class oxidoreductase [Acidimicrobiales bacterium]|nr:TIGR03619 family F420-dependent LLM class oxidoreductase [Acidimicrobiales bacterium]